MTTGWRIWKVEDQRLLSAFGENILPSHGKIVAPPFAGFRLGWFGVCYFRRQSDALKAVAVLDDDPLISVTEGIVTGPLVKDIEANRYRIDDALGSSDVTLPAGMRCSAYQVQRIYADTELVDYGVEVLSLNRLRHQLSSKFEIA